MGLREFFSNLGKGGHHEPKYSIVVRNGAIHQQDLANVLQEKGITNAYQAAVGMMQAMKDMDPEGQRSFLASAGIGLQNLATSYGKALETKAQGQVDAVIRTVNQTPEILRRGQADPNTLSELLRTSDNMINTSIQAGTRTIQQGITQINDLVHNAPQKTTVITETFKTGKKNNGSQLESRSTTIQEPQLPKRANSGHFHVETPSWTYRNGAAVATGNADAGVNHGENGAMNISAHSHGDASAGIASGSSVQFDGGSLDVTGSTIEY